MSGRQKLKPDAMDHFYPQIKNSLLAGLVNKEYQFLLEHLKHVDLRSGEVVYRADSEIEYVYFPETAVVSLLSTTEAGATTEVGLIGSEGMVGLAVFLRGTITHDEAGVLLPGRAMKMKASVLREQLRLGSPLQLLLLRYTRAFLHLVSQSIVCSQNHTIPERLARWLLMMHDYSESDELTLTQEVIASKLGSRRGGVSIATGNLRAAGVISTSRGLIKILDRPGLERITCECYDIIRDEFERLYSSQRLAPKSA